MRISISTFTLADCQSMANAGLRDQPVVGDMLTVGLLGYQDAHVAELISWIPVIGRAGYERSERRSAWTQAEVAKGLNYDTVLGAWSRESGYNQNKIDATVEQAVQRDCKKGGC